MRDLFQLICTLPEPADKTKASQDKDYAKAWLKIARAIRDWVSITIKPRFKELVKQEEILLNNQEISLHIVGLEDLLPLYVLLVNDDPVLLTKTANKLKLALDCTIATTDAADEELPAILMLFAAAIEYKLHLEKDHPFRDEKELNKLPNLKRIAAEIRKPEIIAITEKEQGKEEAKRFSDLLELCEHYGKETSIRLEESIVDLHDFSPETYQLYFGDTRKPRVRCYEKIYDDILHGLCPLKNEAKMVVLVQQYLWVNQLYDLLLGFNDPMHRASEIDALIASRYGFLKTYGNELTESILSLIPSVLEDLRIKEVLWDTERAFNSNEKNKLRYLISACKNYQESLLNQFATMVRPLVEKGNEKFHRYFNKALTTKDRLCLLHDDLLKGFDKDQTQFPFTADSPQMIVAKKYVQAVDIYFNLLRFVEPSKRAEIIDEKIKHREAMFGVFQEARFITLFRAIGISLNTEAKFFSLLEQYTKKEWKVASPPLVEQSKVELPLPRVTGP